MAGWPEVEGDWLIAAPTSAGKTFLAEMAAVEHLARGEKVLWLVPTRALTDWTGQDLRKSLRPAGWEVALTSSDHPDGDGAIEAGGWDVLVAVYEKALQLLARSPDALAGVGLVVIDELGMLRDPERGGRLGVIMALIDASPYTPRRIGLCVAGREAEPLAERLGWQFLTDESRPRPLREGVLDGDTAAFSWRDRTSREEGTEPVCDGGEWDRWHRAVVEAFGERSASAALTATLACAAMLANRGEPTLVFAPSRAAAREWAGILGRAGRDLNDESPAVENFKRLQAMEPCSDHALLLEAARAGVGFHHGDLAMEARGTVEALFADGSLRLLVATPTLSHGLNLAAVNVVQWPQAYREGAGRPPRLGPLERWRWQQQAGRAGRLGFGDAPGRSMVVAAGEEQHARLRRMYIDGEAEPLNVPLRAEALGLGVIAALGGGASRSEENLQKIFAAREPERQRPAIIDGVNRAIVDAKGAGLLENGAQMRLTPRGRICATRGLEPAVMQRLAEWLEIDDPIEGGREGGELVAIWGLALAAPEGYWPCAPRGGRETLHQAREWFEETGEEIPPPLARILSGKTDVVAREMAALEAGWRLAVWIGGEPTPEVEARTGWSAGALANAGEGLAWLAAALAEAGLAAGWAGERAEAWRRLGTRLAAGVTREGVPLARLRIRGLTRSGIGRLVAQGLAEYASIAEVPAEMLEALLADASLASGLRRAAGGAAKARKGFVPSLKAGMNLTGRPRVGWDGNLKLKQPLLELDLQSPGLIRAAGAEVRLTPLAWDLLAALAESPGRVVTRESLYQRLWPEATPEPQQLDAHRRRLLERLDPMLNGRTGTLVEVIRGIGFRLNVAEAEINLRRG